MKHKPGLTAECSLNDLGELEKRLLSERKRILGFWQDGPKWVIEYAEPREAQADLIARKDFCK